jgi:hypothetical protein
MRAGKNKLSTATTVSIAVPIAFSVVLLILGYCFLIRRKKYSAVKGEIGKIPCLHALFFVVQSLTSTVYICRCK